MATKIGTRVVQRGASPVASGAWLAVFYERLEPEIRSRRWHALAYHDCERRKDVMVIWPLHYAVQLAWWLNWKWNRFRHKPGWIDRHANAAIEEYRNRPRFWR